MTKIFLSCTISVGLAPLANDEDFSQLYDKCGARAARQLILIYNSNTRVTPHVHFKAIILTVEPQPAGPTFARSARVNGTCTTYERIYI